MAHVCNVVIMGGGGVGKSAMTLRFVHGTFVSEYDPTIEDAYRKQTDVDGKVVVFEILDTAGQDEYITIKDQWMQAGDVMILVFGINNRSSFEECKDLRQAILRVRDVETFPVVLVGNKSDLGPRQRKVSMDMATELALEWNAPYIEVSAKMNTNVAAAFNLAYREANSASQEKESSKKKKKDSRKCTIL